MFSTDITQMKRIFHHVLTVKRGNTYTRFGEYLFFLREFIIVFYYI